MLSSMCTPWHAARSRQHAAQQHVWMPHLDCAIVLALGHFQLHTNPLALRKQRRPKVADGAAQPAAVAHDHLHRTPTPAAAPDQQPTRAAVNHGQPGKVSARTHLVAKLEGGACTRGRLSCLRHSALRRSVRVHAAADVALQLFWGRGSALFPCTNVCLIHFSHGKQPPVCRISCNVLFHEHTMHRSSGMCTDRSKRINSGAIQKRF